MPGKFLQPSPALIVDANGQVLFGSIPEGFIVVGDPLDGGALIGAVVLVFRKNIYAARGHQGLFFLPIGVVVPVSLGAFIPDVPLHRPHPGEVASVQTDDPGLAAAVCLVRTASSVEQVLHPVLYKGGHIGPTTGAPDLKGRSDHLPRPVHHADDQGVAGIAVVKMGRGQSDILAGADGIQQLSLHAVGERLCGVEALGQGVQNGPGAPRLAALGGGILRNACRTALAGHQIAAQQADDQHEKEKGQGRALFFPLEDAADSQLDLPGRPGQPGGEGGAGNFFHLNIPPFVLEQKGAAVTSHTAPASRSGPGH